MTPQQALACIEQERLDVMAEGMTEADCNMIAAYVLASEYRKLAFARSEIRDIPPGFVQQLRAMKRSLEGAELYGYCDECDRLLAILGESKHG